MKKRELTIVVAGTSASGKSRVAYIINKALKEAGLTNVNFDLTDEIKDYGSKESFEDEMEHNFEFAIEAINEKTNIILKQVQIVKLLSTNK